MIISGGGITIPGRPLAGGNAPPATPLTIIQSVPVLQWVRADLGITLATGVSAWADQSGSAKHYTQAAGASQPAYTPIDATLNGQPSLTFDGLNDSLASALNVGPPHFIINVLRVNVPGIQYLCGTIAGSNASLEFTDATNIYQNNGVSANNLPSPAVGAWVRTFENFSNSAADYLTVATRGKKTGANAGGNTTTGYSLGGLVGGNLGKVSFAEVIVCAGEPTPSELAAIDAYLVARYGQEVVYGNPISIFGAASVLQWCRADLGVTIGTGVSAWADQSANANHYTQATAGFQPTRTAADATLNNLPTIGFDGVDDTLASPLVLPQASVTPACILFVAKVRATTGSNLIIFCPAAAAVVNTLYIDPTGTSAIMANGGSAGSVPHILNKWYRGRADFSNSAGDILRMGANQNTGNAGNSAPSAAGRAISGWPALPVSMAIFEILYLNKIPSVAEMTAFDAYVNATTAGAAAV